MFVGTPSVCDKISSFSRETKYWPHNNPGILSSESRRRAAERRTKELRATDEEENFILVINGRENFRGE